MTESIPRRRSLRRFPWVRTARGAARLTIGVALGLLASLVLLLTLEMLARALRQDSPTSSLGSAAVFIPWGLTATALLYRAAALSKVFARACLLGAAQWVAMIPVVLLLASSTVPVNNAQGQLAEYQMKLILGSSAMAMALLCLSGYAAIAGARRAWRRFARSGADVAVAGHAPSTARHSRGGGLPRDQRCAQSAIEQSRNPSAKIGPINSRLPLTAPTLDPERWSPRSR